jgi:hypothetical protein
MARAVDARNSTLIGTPEQLKTLIELIAGPGAAAVKLNFSNFVVLDKPLTHKQLEAALRIVPGKRR